MRAAKKVKHRLERHLDAVRNGSSRANFSASCSNTRKDPLLDNIVAVEISASPYATEILTESPMYTWVDLISSIGGQTGTDLAGEAIDMKMRCVLGLWIGVSLISFVEIAELLFRLLYHYLRLLYRAGFKWGKKVYEHLFPSQWTTHM